MSHNCYRLVLLVSWQAPRACDAVQGTAIRCLPLWITCEDTSLHSHLTKWLRWAHVKPSIPPHPPFPTYTLILTLTRPLPHVSSLLDRFTELSVEVCVELCTSAGSIMAAVCPPGVVRVVHAHQWDTPFHQASTLT